MSSQVVCANQECDTLPQPLFPPAPQPAPNNVLTIPVQNQNTNICDAGQLLNDAINDFQAINPEQGRDCVPTHMVVGDCFAEIDGCDSSGRTCTALAIGPNAPACMQDNTCTANDLAPSNWRFNSDPNFDQKLLDGTACSLPPLVVTANPNNPPPPPPTTFCTSPCVLVVQPGGGSACVCDPPTPSPLPKQLKPLVIQRQRPKSTPPLKLALNPTVRPGMPVILKYCDCNRNTGEELEVVA